MENSLDLFVNNEATGQLAKEKKRFVFNYHQISPEDRFVSLTMPKRLSSYLRSSFHRYLKDPNTVRLSNDQLG